MLWRICDDDDVLWYDLDDRDQHWTLTLLLPSIMIDVIITIVTAAIGHISDILICWHCIIPFAVIVVEHLILTQHLFYVTLLLLTVCS